MSKDSFSNDYKKLEEILDWFDSAEFDLDAAQKKFSEAQTLITGLKKRVDEAKLSVEKLKADK